MDIFTSIFLAKAWGIYLVITCLAFLINRKNLERLIKEIEDEGFLMLSGFIALLIGIVTVLLHNIWVADWRVIITIFGWLALIKGALRLFWPQIAVKTAKFWTKNSFLISPMLLICLILGGYLLYLGFYFGNLFGGI